MKAFSVFALSGIALTSALLASPPLDPAGLKIEPAVKPVPERKIAICGVAPGHGAMKKMTDMEANEDSIQSVLQNKEAKTTIDKLNAHIVVKSMEDALKHLTRASMEKINVDFEKQQLVIFAWQGSGQDRLTGFHPGSKGALASFHYAPGRTRDLRTHTDIYSMPKDSKVKVMQMVQRPMVPDCKIPAPVPKKVK